MTEQMVSSQTASHLPEKLEFFAKALRGQDAYDVFIAVSKGHRKPKFVSDLVQSTGLGSVRVSQVAARLAGMGLITKGRTTNQVTGKKENFYEKLHSIDVLKDRIVRLRNNPSSLSKLVTMRRPENGLDRATFFVKAAPKTSRQRILRPARQETATLRIAFLGTNPEASNPLRTDIEARNLARAMKSTTNRGRIAIRYIPAAEWSDLLDVMNEFQPHIVHFSGHGGGQGILFDNESGEYDGGLEIDYDLLNKFLGATSFNPDLLILNACDTVKGARIFLDNVKAVVAMSDAIDDSSATYFSKFMYVAIAEGQSLSKAVLQGTLALSAMRLPDSKLPIIIARKGLDPESIRYF